jgi:hypothetical protein
MVSNRSCFSSRGDSTANHFGGRDAVDNVVHRSSCSFLHRNADSGARTKYGKFCGVGREEVEREATRLRGAGGWKHCGSCLQ